MFKLMACFDSALPGTTDPQTRRKINLQRFGKEEINLLFVNFRGCEIGGHLDWSKDPSGSVLEARAFQTAPFESIAHVYKVLFVEQRLHPGNLGDYEPVSYGPLGRYSKNEAASAV